MSKDEASFSLQPETLAAQGGGHTDMPEGAVVPPIIASTTFARRAQDYELIGSSSYTRDHNPTSETAENLLAELEKGIVEVQRRLGTTTRYPSQPVPELKFTLDSAAIAARLAA